MTMITRRDLLKTGAAAGTLLAFAGRAFPFALSPTSIRKFTVTLPGVGPAAVNNYGQYIPLASNTPGSFAGQTTDVYKLGIAKFAESMHPDLPGATHFYGYYDLAARDQKYLGGAIVATRGTPVLLNVTNQLPNSELIPIDKTVMATETKTVGDLPLNRAATHMHGGFTPWFSDGTPFQWYTPSGMTGSSFKNVPGTSPPAGTATYYYPMQQSARLAWYHDHAMGITRTNAYAGIASALIITDDFETYLLKQGLLPDLVGVPLVIQDKAFVPINIHTQDPTWRWGGPGDLWYPHVYEANGATNPKGRWELGPATSKLPAVSCVPECFFDTTIVNGAPYPVVNVTDRTFRFRLLNASQARFWHLNLYQELGSTGEADLTKPGPTLYQVGTEGGFLSDVAVHPNGIPCPVVAPDTVNPDGPFNLLLAPAERADLLIDFTGLAGKSFILYADAPAPFPGGDPRNDYYTGDPDQTATGGAPPTAAGYGPNTRTVLRIVVAKGASGALTARMISALRDALRANYDGGVGGVVAQQPPLLAPWDSRHQQYVVPRGVPVLNKTLNEDFDDYGRLLQRGGTDRMPSGSASFGLDYVAAATEVVSAGEVQAWDFYNTTADVHPWHFHLVNVQVVGRGIYATKADGVTPDFGNFTDLRGVAGRLTPPDANEKGWKETVRMNPGEVTRVIMKFDLPKLPQVMGDPKSPRTGGHEYVHHCHILEHEEHDMMRPLIVK
jgi:spore coat protein A